jgi:hypothetical protein
MCLSHLLTTVREIAWRQQDSAAAAGLIRDQSSGLEISWLISSPSFILCSSATIRDFILLIMERGALFLRAKTFYFRTG